MQKRILIWTIGDNSHGMGHVCRSLVLADELTRAGAEVLFSAPIGTAGHLRIARSPYSLLSGRGDYPNVALNFYDALIIDVEGGPSLELLQKVRPLFRKVITLGAAWSFPFQAPRAIAELVNLQIWQSILTAPPYSGNSVSGIEWLIIRPAYRDCVPDKKGPIVIAMGGADPHNLTEIAAEKLEALDRPVRIVLGPARAQAFTSRALPRECEIIDAPDSLVAVFDGASLTVGALGMLAYESLCAGVPCLLTNWSEDHERTAAELERRGVASNLGMWQNFANTAFVEFARDLFPDRAPSLWKGMSGRARALVDGQGASRAAERVMEEMR